VNQVGEGREYISHQGEHGNIHIAEEVLAVIAAAAALEVEGVGGMASSLGSEVSELVGKKVLAKGVRIQVVEDNITVNIAVLVKYGFVVPDVARGIQDAVMSAVANTSGLNVQAVNVHVAGVTFGK
jgi:uncharacterized alkaline shock family protein YloU